MGDQSPILQNAHHKLGERRKGVVTARSRDLPGGEIDSDLIARFDALNGIRLDNGQALIDGVSEIDPRKGLGD